MKMGVILMGERVPWLAGLLLKDAVASGVVPRARRSQGVIMKPLVYGLAGAGVLIALVAAAGGGTGAPEWPARRRRRGWRGGGGCRARWRRLVGWPLRRRFRRRFRQ